MTRLKPRITTIAAYSYNDFFIKAAKQLVARGIKRSSRVGTVTELSPFHAQITDPTNCWFYLPGRRGALWATVAEIFWLLAGRCDTAFLGLFLDRAKEYADGEGHIWTRGYGPVISRNLWRLVELLDKNPDERRAALVMWTPWDLDLAVLGGKDLACNVMIQFYSRQEGDRYYLDVYAYLRSNDLLFGTQINVAEWTFLQQIIANQLGWEVGHYYHTVTTLHVYDKFKDRLAVKKVVTTPAPLQVNVKEAETYARFWVSSVEQIAKSGGRAGEQLIPWLDFEEMPIQLRALGLFALYFFLKKHGYEPRENVRLRALDRAVEAWGKGTAFERWLRQDKLYI